MENEPLGQILLKAKLLTKEQLDHAVQEQRTGQSGRLGDILVDSGVVTEQQLIWALSKRLRIGSVDLSVTEIDPAAAKLMPEETAVKYNAVPIKTEGKKLVVATSDPMDFYALDDMRLATNREIRLVLAAPSDIRSVIGRLYSRQQVIEAADDISREFDLGAAAQNFSQGVNQRINDAPVVKLVSSIIQQAVKLNASDIHIEPMEKATRIRMRIDGQLREQMRVPVSAHGALVTRLKIMGGMNIAEKRVPQDGKVETVVDGRRVDLRLSSMPTVNGEKIVVRVLGGMSAVPARGELGLSGSNASRFDEVIKSRTGIILVTGPTGSGKTTTLYSILSEFNRPETNIITVEDPVEYHVPGINQVQINTKAGLTFASGLRSILRQDPDIIMIGEIRDSETAEIAVRSAITGHLVLSTMHTNDAASSISRLIDMGIEPYLVSSGLTGIIAQRLVRKICPRCKKSYVPDGRAQDLLGAGTRAEQLFRGEGCQYCSGTGYSGRTAIHEIIVMTRDLRELVYQRVSDDELRRAAIAHGMTTLLDNCRQLVLDGTTTVDEFLKLTYNIELQ